MWYPLGQIMRLLVPGKQMRGEHTAVPSSQIYTECCLRDTKSKVMPDYASCQRCVRA